MLATVTLKGDRLEAYNVAVRLRLHYTPSYGTPSFAASTGLVV